MVKSSCSCKKKQCCAVLFRRETFSSWQHARTDALRMTGCWRLKGTPAEQCSKPPAVDGVQGFILVGHEKPFVYYLKLVDSQSMFFFDFHNPRTRDPVFSQCAGYVTNINQPVQSGQNQHDLIFFLLMEVVCNTKTLTGPV